MEEIVTDVEEQGSDTQPENNTATADNNVGFFVPDEYKEAGWTKNIKSYEDLWKMNANAQKMVGQKTIGIPTENSTDEEVLNFYSKIRPEKAEDYAVELEGDDKALFEKLFFDNGISARQAKALVGGYKESVEKMNAQMFSQESYNKEMAERFGEKYDAKVKTVVDFITKEADEKDKAALEALPNNVLGVLYSLVDKVQTRYAVKDTDVAKNGSVKASNEPNWSEYTKAMSALSTRPHSTSDIIELKDKFNIPYTK